MSQLKLLVVLMLTNLKYILVYNTKQYKHGCSERCSPKSQPPKKTKDKGFAQERLQRKQRHLKQGKGMQEEFLV